MVARMFKTKSVSSGSDGRASADPAVVDSLAGQLRAQAELLKQQSQSLKEQTQLLQEQGRMLEVLGKAALRDVLADVDSTIQDRTMSMMETMDRVREGASLARWGDGEIRLMLQPEFNLSFQQPDPGLASELASILEGYDKVSPDLLLAFPTTFVSRLWMGIWAENWHLLGPILKRSSARWANTHVSRPLFFQKHRQDAVKAWRSVWEDKRVCIVAGRGSRFELLPELFDNVRSVSRIDSLPKDAYAEIDQTVESVLAAPMADVYLAALGPTGTVLASRLAAKGLHAVDVGHLASSYANVFLGGKFPEQQAVVGKR